MIREENGKYCLYSQDGSKKLGCFPTVEQAQKHEAQIKAIVAARQAIFGIVTNESLRAAGVDWPLPNPTDLSILIDDESFQFAAAYGDIAKLFGQNSQEIRQDTFDVIGEKGGKEFEVCIIEEGWAKASEGNPPIMWTSEALADSALHAKLENSPVRIYQAGGEIFNHAPLDTVNQSGHKLTANNAGILSNVRYGDFTRPDGSKSRGVLGTLHVTMSDVANFLKKGWQLGKRLLGLSIDANIAKDFIRNAVIKVNSIKETTLVSHPAAGGYLLELRASASNNPRGKNMDKLLMWLEANNAELHAKLMAATGAERDALILEAQQAMSAATQTEPTKLEKEELKAKPEPPAPTAKADEFAGLPTEEETGKFVEAALQMAVGLPSDFKNIIRQEYTKRRASPTTVMESIARQQHLAAKILRFDKPLTIAPANDIVTVKSEQDKFNDAMMGLFTGRDENKVPRFRSLRQSYYEIVRPEKFLDNAQAGRLMFNEVPFGLAPLGMDQEAWFVRLRQTRESMAYSDTDLRQSLLQTSSWTTAFGNTLHRFLLQIYMAPDLQDYKRIISSIDNVQDFKAQTFTRIGGYSNLPTVNEGSTYVEATHPAEESVNYSVVKRGELAFFTWESFVNDDIGAIKQVPQKVVRAAAQTKYEFFFDLLRLPGTWAPDSVAIFDNAHGNLSSTAFSSVALQAIILAMRDQTELTSGKPVHFNPKLVVYPNEIDRAVWESIKDTISNFGVSGTFNRNETLANWLQSQFQMDGIRVPYWTDANDYCVIADPTQHDTIIAGFLGGREEPEMWFADRPDSYHMFVSDKIALKIRDIYGGTYGDYRSLHKASVT